MEFVAVMNTVSISGNNISTFNSRHIFKNLLQTGDIFWRIFLNVIQEVSSIKNELQTNNYVYINKSENKTRLKFENKKLLLN